MEGIGDRSGGQATAGMGNGSCKQLGRTPAEGAAGKHLSKNAERWGEFFDVGERK